MGLPLNSLAICNPYSPSPPWPGGKAVTRQIFMSSKASSSFTFDESSGADVGCGWPGSGHSRAVCADVPRKCFMAALVIRKALMANPIVLAAFFS
jgi:hypothetical protein